MKYAVIYFAIGCVVVGSHLNTLIKRCPSVELPAIERIAVIAAIWPVFFIINQPKSLDGRLSCEITP